MQILRQLYSNHVGIEKTRLLACELVYWINMNADIENIFKDCSTCLKYQNTQLEEKTTPYEVPAKPWEIVGADSFIINNEKLLYIVDYYSKFLVIKRWRAHWLKT